MVIMSGCDGTSIIYIKCAYISWIIAKCITETWHEIAVDVCNFDKSEGESKEVDKEVGNITLHDAIWFIDNSFTDDILVNIPLFIININISHSNDSANAVALTINS